MQRVLVETQLPVHHLLVVELKLNVASGRNMDLGLECLHVQIVSPAERIRNKNDTGNIFIVSLKDAAGGSEFCGGCQYLTMPAAFPLALA